MKTTKWLLLLLLCIRVCVTACALPAVAGAKRRLGALSNNVPTTDRRNRERKKEKPVQAQSSFHPTPHDRTTSYDTNAHTHTNAHAGPQPSTHKHTTNHPSLVPLITESRNTESRRDQKKYRKKKQIYLRHGSDTKHANVTCERPLRVTPGCACRCAYFSSATLHDSHTRPPTQKDVHTRYTCTGPSRRSLRHRHSTRRASGRRASAQTGRWPPSGRSPEWRS